MAIRPRAVENMAMIGLVDAALWHGRRVLLRAIPDSKAPGVCFGCREWAPTSSDLPLAPETEPSLYQGAQVAADVDSRIGDLRDRVEVRRVVEASDPEIVLHMTSQAIMRRAFYDPIGTVASNILGTVHLLDALREVSLLRVVLVITRDKVYDNADTGVPFREDDPLGAMRFTAPPKRPSNLSPGRWHEHTLTGASRLRRRAAAT